MKMKKKILIIGGAGFIGHNLAVFLKKKKFDILTVDNLKVNNFGHVKKNVKDSFKKKLYLSFLNERLNLLKKHKIKLRRVDVTQKNTLSHLVSSYKPDFVIHLAAVSHDNRSNSNPNEAFENSFRTIFNTLEAIKNLKKTRLIYFSSSMVYGTFKKKLVSENDICQPIGIYASLKFSAEQLIKSYANVFSTHYTIVRPSALYGERCISNRVIQVFLENAFQGKKIIIKGNGEEKLDFTYIKDLCNGVYKIIIKNNKSKNQTFNITFGLGRTINNLKRLIIKKFKNQRIDHLPWDKLVPKRGTLSTHKAKKRINYTSKFKLEKGFEEYYKWYKLKVNEIRK
mgnify:CR=1 FL=1